MADTIKEFLVGLGFKVDDVQYRRMMDSIGRVTSGVFKLGAGTTTAAFAIEAGIEKIARQFSNLYYQAQLSGASVSGLMRMDYAAGQIGLSSEAATSAVQSLGSALRTNPGTEGFLQSLGVATRKGGALRDTNDLLLDLVGNLKRSFSYPVAAQIAGQLGIAEPTFRLMYLNYDRLIEQQKELARIQQIAGINADDTSEKFLQFDRTVQHLGTEVETLGQQIATTFLPFAQKGIDVIDQWTLSLLDFNARLSESSPLLAKFVEAGEALTTIGLGGAALGGFARMILRGLGIGGAARAAGGVAGAAAGGAGAAEAAGAGAAATEAAGAGAGIGLFGALGLAGGALLGGAGEAYAVQKMNEDLPDGMSWDPENGYSYSGSLIHNTGPYAFSASKGGMPTSGTPSNTLLDRLTHKTWTGVGSAFSGAGKFFAPNFYPEGTAYAPGDAQRMFGGDPASLTRKFESGGNYNIGFGGVDLSGAPHDRFGFPIWMGRMGPAGMSHAAGAYQFEPATWDRYAAQLGIHDFSPASQDAVFNAAFAAEGMKPWMSDRPLMAALGAGGPRAERPLEVHVSQNNTFNIEGAGDPNVAAASMARRLTQLNNDWGSVVRNQVSTSQ